MSVLPIMISITALFDFGIMTMMFMSMVVGAFFVPMIMCMSIILFFFHVSRRIILVIMMFVPMVMSALLVAMIMCMRIVGIIILELG